VDIRTLVSIKPSLSTPVAIDFSGNFLFRNGLHLRQALGFFEKGLQSSYPVCLVMIWRQQKDFHPLALLKRHVVQDEFSGLFNRRKHLVGFHDFPSTKRPLKQHSTIQKD
jgi:hypothetical protein